MVCLQARRFCFEIVNFGSVFLHQFIEMSHVRQKLIGYGFIVGGFPPDLGPWYPAHNSILRLQYITALRGISVECARYKNIQAK